MFSANREIAKTLYENGADINAVTSDNENALMIASKSGASDVVDYFIELGMDVNAKDKKGCTVLDYAEKYGFSEIVEVLKSKY